MEEYVRLYGDGDSSNLRFSHGQRGGSGRGPVDEYNKLCDILRALREKAGGEGKEVRLGPVRKFLAKDILYWNQAWGDDAFAEGFEPGWVGWLERRRKGGLLLSEWEVSGVGVGEKDEVGDEEMTETETVVGKDGGGEADDVSEGGTVFETDGVFEDADMLEGTDDAETTTLPMRSA